jgi:flagellar biogenesis protein FliO
VIYHKLIFVVARMRTFNRQIDLHSCGFRAVEIPVRLNFLFGLALIIFSASLIQTSVAAAEDFYQGSNRPVDSAYQNGVPHQPDAVRPISHQEVVPAAFQSTGGEKPLLLPNRPDDSSTDKFSSGPRAAGAIISVIASLAVVLGLFFIIAWLMRRNLPTSARRLPTDVVETLGRTPLVGRQQLHVLRFGNKLLLVCVSPTGAQTLADISDPDEIDRVADLCRQSSASGAGKALRQMLGDFTTGKSALAANQGARKTPFASSTGLPRAAGEVADV